MLLFDANLSPVLSEILEDVFPDSLHVFEKNLEGSDEKIWLREFSGRLPYRGMVSTGMVYAKHASFYFQNFARSSRIPSLCASGSFVRHTP